MGAQPEVPYSKYSFHTHTHTDTTNHDCNTFITLCVRKQKTAIDQVAPRKSEHPILKHLGILFDKGRKF